MRPENFSILIAILILIIGGSLCCFSKSSQKLSPGHIKLYWASALVLCMYPFSVLVWYLLTSNFELTYVYEHTCESLPTIYKISALWSGQQGSLLLWAVILLIIGFAVVHMALTTSKRILGIYSIICASVCFLAFITNPFETILSTSLIDGLGLALALQDPWMVAHPPLVFVGYSCMAVLFSLSCISPIGFLGQYNGKVIPFPANPQVRSSNCNKIINSWLKLSCAFLGLGILSGCVWAYRALGWGGYWSWDAIENIALIPWLVMCAFLHGKLQYSKGICIIPFIIAAFGTFLVRSGVLQNSSVHAYAAANSSFALILLMLIIAIALIIFVILIKTKKILICGMNVKDKLQMLRLIIYIYSIILLVATLIPVLTTIEMPMLFYSITATIFAVIVCVLLLWYQARLALSRYIAILVVSTLITACILLLFRGISAFYVLLFWICMIPLSLYIVTFRRTIRSSYATSHMFVVLLILGVIASTGFSSQLMDIVDVNNNSITVEGKVFSASPDKEHLTLMINTLSVDYIISNLQSLGDNTNRILVTYCSKPLIILFWAGSFLLIIYCFISYVKTKQALKR